MILEEIESQAEEILSTLGIKNIPIPVEDIVTRLNIRVSRGPSKDFSGMLIRKNDAALIGINSNEAPVRQRFTIAHELGHFLIHPRKDAFVDYRIEHKRGVVKSTIEREADMFAAALLMPRSLLEKDFVSVSNNGFTEEELKILAKKYQTSVDAMKFRLINLKLPR